MDALCTLSSEVRDDDALQTNIKNVIRRALVCEKVNVFTVDTMRQELIALAHLSHQDDIHDLTTQVTKLEAELKELEQQRDALNKQSSTDAINKLQLCEGACEHARQHILVLKRNLEASKMLQEASKGSRVRLRFKQGQAGRVAASGGYENTTHDPGDEKLMDIERRSVHDRAVRTMLCTCVYSHDGELVGVVQAFNKSHGIFTRDDEKLMQTLCGQAGVMLHHSQLLVSMRKQSQARFDLCNFSVKVLDCQNDSAIGILVAQLGPKVLAARKCCFWIFEPATRSIWMVDKDGEIVRQNLRDISTTVVGKAAVSGDVIMQSFNDVTEQGATNLAEDDSEEESGQGQRAQAHILKSPVE